MNRRVLRYPNFEAIAVGTVGEPGNRAFYLQVRSPGAASCLLLEKIQLAAVVERMRILLKELRRGRFIEDEEIASAPLKPGLWKPIEPDFRVGVMAISWESEGGTIELQLQAIVDQEDADQEEADQEEAADGAQGQNRQDEIDADSLYGPDLVCINFTIARLRSFITCAQEVIDSGRAPCPLCGQPADPSGHLCPRANGYRR